MKNSKLGLRACPLAVVERTIRNRSENKPESNCRSPPVGTLPGESNTSGNLQGICMNARKTLQILSRDFRRFASPLNGLGIFHRRRCPTGRAEKSIIIQCRQELFPSCASTRFQQTGNKTTSGNKSFVVRSPPPASSRFRLTFGIRIPGRNG